MVEPVRDQLDKMMAWENGELDDDDTISLFQELINSGVVWKLQGTYGRTAANLINNGYCTRPATDYKLGGNHG